MPDSELSLWMRFGQPLEPVIEDYERVFDGWQEGGVTGVVFGRLLFVTESGTTASFDPNPAIYREMGVESPEPPDEKLPGKRKLLEAALTNAKERGLDLFVFCPDGGQGLGGEGHTLVDERSLAARVARIRDVMEAYPMVDGGVLDGPELGYEITPGHRSNIFEDTPDTLRSAAGDLGFDFDAMIAARDRFEQKLHTLSPKEIDLRSGVVFSEPSNCSTTMSIWRRGSLSGGRC